MRAFGITENDVVDADIFVPKAPLLFHFTSLFRIEHGTSAVYPAGTDAEGMSGVEHVGDTGRAVLQIGRAHV